MSEIKKWKYPDLPNIDSMRDPPIEAFLGKMLYWTEKRDGECAGIWKDEEGVHVSSRNLKDAQEHFKAKVVGTEEYPKILEFLEDHPVCVLYVELLKPGKSPTKIEFLDKTSLVAFDMRDGDDKFVPYRFLYQQCYHYKIPAVELWFETRHTTIRSLLKQADEVLDYAKKLGNREGAVVKTVAGGERVYAKVKLDIPAPTHKKKVEKGAPRFPPIPESEIYGAISRVYSELEDPKDFFDAKIAMPLIARAISEEQKKHKRSKPIKKLFAYYKDVCREKLNVEE